METLQDTLTSQKSKFSKNSRNSITPFIMKIYQILQDESCHQSVTWSKDGNGFLIQDFSDLSNRIMPKYFKHSNYSSFVRQLNMYGFHKIKSEQEEVGFYHALFKRNGNELHKIKRMKLSNNKSDEDEEDESFVEGRSQTRSNRKETARYKEIEAFETGINQLNEKFKRFEDTAKVLRTSVEKQNNQMKVLVSELAHLREDGNKKINILLKELFADHMAGTQELFVDQTIASYEQAGTFAIPSHNFASNAQSEMRMECNGQFPSKLCTSKIDGQNRSILENSTKTHEQSFFRPKNSFQNEWPQEAWMNNQQNLRLKNSNLSAYSYSMQTANQQVFDEWNPISEEQQPFSNPSASYFNQNLNPNWEFQEDFYYNNDNGLENSSGLYPYKKAQKISLNGDGAGSDTNILQSQALYYS